MKIAMIGHKRIPSREGGVEKVVEEHVVRMVRRGHTVEVYNRGGAPLYGARKNTGKRREYQGVRIITIPTVRGSAEVPLYSLLATLRAIFGRYDVICYHASGPCAMIPLAKLFGLRCVASLHGIDSQRDKWSGFAVKYLEFGEKMAATRADACLVLSRNAKAYIKNRYGTDAVLFANGISPPERRAVNLIRSEYGLEEQEYVLSLGRITPEKGLHHLIRAFRTLDTDKKLVVAGGVDVPAYAKQLRELAAGDDRILFPGFVDGEKKAELYSNAYLFALPSSLEGMANSLLEAMAYGNCCLLSDIPENTEVAEDHAVYFPTGDEAALAEKLRELLNAPETADEFRRGAAEFILSRYDWDRVVDQMLEIYSGHIVEYQTELTIKANSTHQIVHQV